MTTSDMKHEPKAVSLRSDHVVDLAQELIRLKTISTHPDQLYRGLELCRARITTGTVELFDCNGCRSLLAYNRQTRPERFKVILNGHLDVIPGKDSQYLPEIRDGKLFGVGATDMKANVACIIDVFNNMATRVTYPLALQLVTDEELGGFWGTKHQIEQGVRADFVIAAESTNFDIVHQAKGILWIKVLAHGQAAHGAYPWRGDNAVMKMVRFLETLEHEYPTPSEQVWRTTINVGSINCQNQAYNKIPDSCEAHLDIRFLPGEASETRARLEALIPHDLSYEIVADEPALFVPDTNPFLQELQRVTYEVRQQRPSLYCAQGSSDARHYTRAGDAGVEFGPIGGGIGSDEEWIDIASLHVYREILRGFLTKVALV